MPSSPTATQGNTVQHDRKPLQLRFEANINGKGGGPLAKLLGATVAIAAIVAGLFLSVFVLAGLLIAGLAAGGWFWWRTRSLRRQFRETLAAAELAAARQAEALRESASKTAEAPGTVIEGDFIRPKQPPET